MSRCPVLHYNQLSWFPICPFFVCLPGPGLHNTGQCSPAIQPSLGSSLWFPVFCLLSITLFRGGMAELCAGSLLYLLESISFRINLCSDFITNWTLPWTPCSHIHTLHWFTILYFIDLLVQNHGQLMLYVVLVFIITESPLINCLYLLFSSAEGWALESRGQFT